MDDEGVSDAMSTVLSIAIVVLAGLAIAGIVLDMADSQGRVATARLSEVADSGLEKGLAGFYYTLDPASDPASPDPVNTVPDRPVARRIDQFLRLDRASLPPVSPENGGLTIWSGYVYAPTDADYTFHLSSAGGAWLWVDRSLVADNHGDHPLRTVESQPVHLTPGLHPIKVKYCYATAAAAHCHLAWSAGGAAVEPAYYH